MTTSKRSVTLHLAYCFAMSNSFVSADTLVTAPAAAEASPVADPSIQSVSRAISVLEILARRGDVRVTELAVELGVHKSTAFRLLAALEQRGLVEQDHDRGRYRLGFGLVRLAGAVTARMDVNRVGRPVCERLAVRIGETMNIAVAHGAYAVNVDQVPGPAAISAHNWVGQLTPLHATSSGKVLLAAMSPGARAGAFGGVGLTRFTTATITSASRLERELRTVTQRGYATTVEEYEPGLNAVAAPVRDSHGAVVAAVSASGPAFRLTPERMAQLAEELCDGADEISHLLGYLGAGSPSLAATQV
jgi:DNA-binding IclR family transcriptional regulator